MKLPHYLKSSEDDVIQDVMIRLMKADQRKGVVVKNYGYMKQTVMSVVIDYTRKFKLYQSTACEFNEEKNDHHQNNKQNPVEVAHQQDMLQLVYQAIGQLSEVRKTSLLLYLRGMKIKEIAQVCQMSIASVRNEVYRGKSDILKILNAQGVNYEV